MGRLTDTINGVVVYVGPGRESVGGSLPIEMTTQQVRTVLARLAAYEATGLAPECCAELARDDKDGRLVVLPCKVGDTVWLVLHDLPQFYPETSGWYIGEITVRAVTDKGFCDGEIGADCIIPWDELGKTVFLTREEAEQALKEAKGRWLNTLSGTLCWRPMTGSTAGLPAEQEH